ncbi:MAG: amino acid permease [Desulfovibrio sp.]|nr:amino acid permease [Desulfovibrio sp.]
MAEHPTTPPKSFSSLALWAMSFGCCVGWGAFVLPGNMFLPKAGPIGASAMLAIGALAMVVIAFNYHYLMRRHPGDGGTFRYVQAVLGYDHAFLCGWFLWLVYAAIIWANASAVPLLVHHFFGKALHFGFHYTLAGYDIYFGEVLSSSSFCIVLGLLCLLHNRAAVLLNVLFALLLACGVAGIFAAIYGSLDCGFAIVRTYPFAPQHSAAFQIFSLLSLAPWAFVGFEVVSQVTEESSCRRKHFFGIMASAIICAAAAYALLLLIGAAPLRDVVDWGDYASIIEAGGEATLTDLPVPHAVETHLGQAGNVVLGLAILGALGTGVMGFMLAGSRLTCTLADSKVFAPLLARRTAQGVPCNAILLLIGSTVIVSLAGRTAIVWIVDITSVCATIAYAYISACAFISAHREGRTLQAVVGAIGFLLALAFSVCSFLPAIWSITSLSAESYCVFSLWGVLGFLIYLIVFRHDTAERFGHSTFVWAVMLFMILASSLMWMRQAAHESASQTLREVREFYDELMIIKHNPRLSQAYLIKKEDDFIDEHMDSFGNRLVKHSIFQILLIVFSIIMVFAVYSHMHNRRRQAELDKYKAINVSRAKSEFLSKVSHDIRTPMNAIIGFTDLALTKNDAIALHDYLRKIKLSSNHLLTLLNDVLEMSRIESGKIEIHPAPTSIPQLLHDLRTIIIGQIVAKGHQLHVNAQRVYDEDILCDKLRLNQILLNLLSNAIKYTPDGGQIDVNITELKREGEFADYTISVKDNGFGMSPEFAEHIFDSFSRENTDAVDRIQGTGLGMSITKNLTELMGGTIELKTEKGKGSEFILTFRFPVAESKEAVSVPEAIKGMLVLVVDDDPNACESLKEMFASMGAVPQSTTSVTQAVPLYAESAKARAPFELCVSGMGMTEMSGLDIARGMQAAAKEEGIQPPALIIVTAYDWHDIREEAEKAGVRAFCSEPVFASELRAAVAKALSKDDHAEEEGTGPAGDEIFAGKRVLLVDDIDVNREIGVAMMEMHGIEVETACNGKEAVDMVHQADVGYYDLVLMDVQMPVMNGYDATKAIRSLADQDKAGVTIVAMTANAFDEDRKAALQAGMDGHLAKPIDMERLKDMLVKIL